jgi:hypothetical protein
MTGASYQTPIGPTNGGKVYAYNALTTAPVQVAPASPSRVTITFHNPGTVDIFVAPMFTQTTGSNAALAPTNAALGGTFRVYANGGDRTITGECNGAWQAFAASGTTNPLTVVDSNT